jgi:hypothetical protein
MIGGGKAAVRFWFANARRNGQRLKTRTLSAVRPFCDHHESNLSNNFLLAIFFFFFFFFFFFLFGQVQLVPSSRRSFASDSSASKTEGEKQLLHRQTLDSIASSLNFASLETWYSLVDPDEATGPYCPFNSTIIRL